MKEKYLAEAVFVSKRSKDWSTKVGAVIVDSRGHPVSSGYNGLPSGFERDEQVLAERGMKNAAIIHAEINAILFAERSRLVGADLYVWPTAPCSRCAPVIRQVGIKRVFAPDMEHIEHKERERLANSCRHELAAALYGDAVELVIVPSFDFIEAYVSGTAHD